MFLLTKKLKMFSIVCALVFLGSCSSPDVSESSVAQLDTGRVKFKIVDKKEIIGTIRCDNKVYPEYHQYFTMDKSTTEKFYVLTSSGLDACDSVRSHFINTFKNTRTFGKCTSCGI